MAEPSAFRVLCLVCGTVAESWHRDFAAPSGAVIGPARCYCGRVMADALGVPGKGRVVAPDACWRVIEGDV